MNMRTILIAFCMCVYAHGAFSMEAQEEQLADYGRKAITVLKAEIAHMSAEVNALNEFLHGVRQEVQAPVEEVHDSQPMQTSKSTSQKNAELAELAFAYMFSAFDYDPSTGRYAFED